jgi:methylmalonyl-CoA mutase
MEEVTFSSIEVEVWQRQVLSELRGRPLEKLDARLPGGPTIRPLYTKRPDTAIPSGTAGWERCQKHDGAHPDVAAHIAEDLAGGIEAIWLVPGPALDGVADFEAALFGAHRVRLDAGGDGLAAAAVLLASELSLTSDGVRLGLDPLGALASGTLRTDLDTAWGQVAEAHAALSQVPGARAIGLSSAPYHHAGATPEQELGIAAAGLVEVLRAMESAGIAPEAVAESLEWSMPMGRDVFLNVARLRALRALHAAILEQCGVSGSAARIHAFSAESTLTARDPWVNLLRVTTHSYAAVLGGADSITAAPLDAASGGAGALGRRIARNTQVILDEECQIGKVSDPTRGSYYVESLTKTLLEGAWAQLQAISAKGGLAAVLLDGSLAREIAESRGKLTAAIATREVPITGVSEFPILDQPLLPGAASVEPAVSEHYTGPVDLDSLITAARSGVRLSALAAALHGTPPDVTPLPVVREAAAFEALRDRIDAFVAAGHDRPKVYLANLGPRAAWTPRATFAANLLAAGGLAVIEDAGTQDAGPAEAAAQLAERSRGAAAAVICGSDATYVSHGPALVAALSGFTLLAGKTALPGVDRHIHLGCNAVAVLTELLDVLGVTR